MSIRLDRKAEDRAVSDIFGVDWLRPDLADATKAADWDEDKHPRHPAGSGDGGRFAPAGEGGISGDTAEEMRTRLKENEGFTMSRVGDVPTTGYIVAIAGHSGVYDADILNDRDRFIDAVDKWLEAEAEALDGQGVYIGGWYDTQNQKVVFDAVEHFSDREEAIRAGRERDQIAIWDLEQEVEVGTGGTGGYAQAAEEDGSAGKAAKAHQGDDARGAPRVRSRTRWPVRAQVLKDYNPDQPRAADGKWTDGAAGTAVEHERESDGQFSDKSRDAVAVAAALTAGRSPNVAPETVAAVLAEIAKGEAHPDLTELRVDGTFMYGKNGLGYARNEMPQIPSDRREEFFDRLREDDIVIKFEKVDPQSLDPVQKEISAKIIAEFLPIIRERGLGETAIIVSKDDYVIDGHHRWATAVSLSFEQEGVLLPIFRIGLNHTELLEEAWKWNEEVGIKPLEMGERSTRDKVTKRYLFGSDADIELVPFDPALLTGWLEDALDRSDRR